MKTSEEFQDHILSLYSQVYCDYEKEDMDTVNSFIIGLTQSIPPESFEDPQTLKDLHRQIRLIGNRFGFYERLGM